MRRMRSAYRVTEKCRRSATMPMWRWYFYNRSSAVVACAAGVTGLARLPRANILNRSSAVFHPRNIFLQPLFGGFCDALRRWRMSMENGFINGDGNSMTKATAEGRLYNHSPRLACLPGVSCGRINLPPKSGCINHVEYFSKLSQRPAIGSGVPPAREMGRMRRIPARIRFAPRTGLRKSAVAPRRCRYGDGISTTALRR